MAKALAFDTDWGAPEAIGILKRMSAHRRSQLATGVGPLWARSRTSFSERGASGEQFAHTVH